MKIINCNTDDIDLIFEMYNDATSYQKERTINYWPEFDRVMVKNEIINKRHFKLLINEEVACIWCITFDDRLVWGGRNNNKSIYFHRIAAHKNYRGKNYVKKIIDWGTKYALVNEKKYLRLDTVGHNKRLIEYYTKCGFKFLGLTKLSVSNELPQHYQNAIVCLFELKII